MIPVFFLQIWLVGLLSLGFVGGVIFLGHEWFAKATKWDEISQRAYFAPDFGANEETLWLVAAILLGLVVVAGGSLVKGIIKVVRGSIDAPGIDPRIPIPPAAEQLVTRPDGTIIRVRIYGPEEGTPLVCTHGWSLTGDEWSYLIRDLSDHFRVVVWDLPGLGHSTSPADKNFTVDRFARDLAAVLELVSGKPAILLGHSIGGMITLKFCELFPANPGGRVAGLVLVHTTYTNPVRTASGAAILTAIEKPVLKPLMWLSIVLSPLLSLLTWMSYRNGLLHLMIKQVFFSGMETWEQLDFSARFQIKASPSVLARGMLGMMRYDASPVLESIKIPTLVVAGDEDTSTKPGASARIHAEISGSRLITLSPARHMGLIEHHREFSKIVREFILSVTNRG